MYDEMDGMEPGEKNLGIRENLGRARRLLGTGTGISGWQKPSES